MLGPVKEASQHGLCFKHRQPCQELWQARALSGLSMHVPKGAIYGIVGRNGAGKTTLIRLICGLQRPTSGTYSIYGREFTSRDIRLSRRRMGAVVETPSIYLDMSARENLRQQYRVLGLPSFEGIDELLALVGLADTGKKKARNFSLGEAAARHRRGARGGPDFLILDEPVNGLDPEGIIEMRELILRLNRERQITVLISSHILDELAPPRYALRLHRRRAHGARDERRGAGGRLPQEYAPGGHGHRRPRPRARRHGR